MMTERLRVVSIRPPGGETPIQVDAPTESLDTVAERAVSIIFAEHEQRYGKWNCSQCGARMLWNIKKFGTPVCNKCSGRGHNE